MLNLSKEDKEYNLQADVAHYYDCQTGITYEAEFDEETNNKKFVKWELKEEK